MPYLILLIAALLLCVLSLAGVQWTLNLLGLAVLLVCAALLMEKRF